MIDTTQLVKALPKPGTTTLPTLSQAIDLLETSIDFLRDLTGHPIIKSMCQRFSDHDPPLFDLSDFPEQEWQRPCRHIHLRDDRAGSWCCNRQPDTLVIAPSRVDGLIMRVRVAHDVSL